VIDGSGQSEVMLGYAHDLDAEPDEAWLTLPDRDYETLEQEIVRYHTVSRSGEIQVEFGRIYECPECRRIMWARPGDSEYQVFLPE
jgi:hypothetical protein